MKQWELIARRVTITWHSLTYKQRIGTKRSLTHYTDKQKQKTLESREEKVWEVTLKSQ